MRRRRSRKTCVARAAIAAVAFLGAFARPSHAQSGIAKEGALFLLVPIGAHEVGEGQAAVASRLGAEGMWWNPAAIGWVEHRELAVDYSRNAFTPDVTVSGVIPVGRAGVVGFSLLYVDYGDQAATDEFGTTIGTLYSRATVLTASYGATFGDRISAGVSYKLISNSQSCSGACANQTIFDASTSAIDAGIHVVVDSARRWTLGGVVQNAGFGLQTIDREQADPLPARIHLGADYAFGALTSLPGASLHGSAEVVMRINLGSPAYRFGTELSLGNRVFVRGGILLGDDATRSGDGSDAVIGFGFRQGSLGIDFARAFGGTSADAGVAPTYITVRFGFK